MMKTKKATIRAAFIVDCLDRDMMALLSSKQVGTAIIMLALFFFSLRQRQKEREEGK
jgi:hypothetical protein